MPALLRNLLASTALLCLLLPGCAGERLPVDAGTILDKAKSIELLSLDPTRHLEKQADAFHGWRVLGKTSVKDKADRKLLLTALRKGIADSDGSVAGCFNPRHGIRATHNGKSVDLVICFECLSMEVHLGIVRSSVLTTSGPQATLDKLLEKARVPLAEKPGT